MGEREDRANRRMLDAALERAGRAPQFGTPRRNPDPLFPPIDLPRPAYQNFLEMPAGQIPARDRASTDAVEAIDLYNERELQHEAELNQPGPFGLPIARVAAPFKDWLTTPETRQRLSDGARHWVEQMTGPSHQGGAGGDDGPDLFGDLGDAAGDAYRGAVRAFGEPGINAQALGVISSLAEGGARAGDAVSDWWSDEDNELSRPWRMGGARSLFNIDPDAAGGPLRGYFPAIAEGMTGGPWEASDDARSGLDWENARIAARMNNGDGAVAFDAAPQDYYADEMSAAGINAALNLGFGGLDASEVLRAPRLARAAEDAGEIAFYRSPDGFAETTIDPDGRIVHTYQGAYQSGEGSGAEALSSMRSAERALLDDIVQNQRPEYYWRPGPENGGDPRLAQFYRNAFERRTPPGYAFSEAPDGTMRLSRADAAAGAANATGGGQVLNWLGNDRLIRNPTEADLNRLAELGDEMKYVMDADGNIYAFSAADAHHNNAMRALRDNGVTVRPLGAGADVTDPDAAGFIWRNGDGSFSHEDANMRSTGSYADFAQRMRPVTEEPLPLQAQPNPTNDLDQWVMGEFEDGAPFLGDPVYHGTTGEDFAAFDVSRSGTHSGNKDHRGVWVTSSPEHASSFAEGWGNGDRVMPLYARGRFMTLETEPATDADLTRAIERARGDGFDGIRFAGVEGGGATQTLVFDPSNLKPRFGDDRLSARRNDPLASAALIGTGAGAGALLFGGDEASAESLSDGREIVPVSGDLRGQTWMEPNWVPTRLADGSDALERTLIGADGRPVLIVARQSPDLSIQVLGQVVGREPSSVNEDTLAAMGAERFPSTVPTDAFGYPQQGYEPPAEAPEPTPIELRMLAAGGASLFGRSLAGRMGAGQGLRSVAGAGAGMFGDLAATGFQGDWKESLALGTGASAAGAAAEGVLPMVGALGRQELTDASQLAIARDPAFIARRDAFAQTLSEQPPMVRSIEANDATALDRRFLIPGAEAGEQGFAIDRPSTNIASQREQFLSAAPSEQRAWMDQVAPEARPDRGVIGVTRIDDMPPPAVTDAQRPALPASQPIDEAMPAPVAASSATFPVGFFDPRTGEALFGATGRRGPPPRPRKPFDQLAPSSQATRIGSAADRIAAARELGLGEFDKGASAMRAIRERAAADPAFMEMLKSRFPSIAAAILAGGAAASEVIDEGDWLAPPSR